MERLKMVSELKRIEERKNALEKQLVAVESFYLNKVEVSFKTDTTDFTHKGIDRFVEIDTANLKSFLKREIVELTDKSSEIVRNLNS